MKELEADAEFEVTLQRLDERTAQAKKNFAQMSLAEKQKGSNATKPASLAQQGSKPAKRSADEIGDNDKANAWADSTDKIEGKSKVLTAE